MNISLSSFAPENLVSRQRFGSSVPRSLLISILRLNMMLTGFLPISAAASISLFKTVIRHWASPEFIRIVQLRTDGVHCREYAGTGPPVNLNVISNGCCLGRSPWTN